MTARAIWTRLLLLFMCGYIAASRKFRRRKPTAKVVAPAPSRLPLLRSAKRPPQGVPHWTCDTRNLSADAAAHTHWEPTALGTADRPHLQLKIDVPGCDTKLLTHANVMLCLAHRHVVLLGDSITRYSYLSLIQFLELRTWNGETSPGRAEHVGGWGGYNELNAGMNGRFRGREICDCFRGEKNASIGTPKPKWERPRIVEQHYYYNPVWNVRVTFVWRTGSMPMEWHDLGAIGETCHGQHFHARRAAALSSLTLPMKPQSKALAAAAAAAMAAAAAGNGSDVRCPQRYCKPGACSTPGIYTYADEFAGALHLLRDLDPDVVIFNVGLWPNSYSKPATIDRLLRLGAELSSSLTAGREGRLQVYWKTTTQRIHTRPWISQERLIGALRKGGWGIIDTGGVTESIRQRTKRRPGLEAFYFDGTHFRPFVYRGLNEVLLTELCSAGVVWSPQQ